jgi:hypothetical protein
MQPILSGEKMLENTKASSLCGYQPHLEVTTSLKSNENNNLLWRG